MTISLLVNRQRRTVPASPDTPLLYVLRNDLALNGVRFGCGQAQCGACTVMLGKTPVRSCVFPVGAVRGQAVTTVEGLGTSGQLHPLQQAFIDEQAAQCGYCSSGMLMAAKALLDATPHPDEQAVRSALAGQKCRCGAHSRIVRAVLRAAEAMRA
uniref:(2Fe-2S)-binding domain-containing protein n=1 Tax=Burkholderia sp. (strain CCGE1003) TaxID=640512 RepID=E1TFS7_BURSG